MSGLALIKGPSQINVVIKSILIKTLFRPIGLTNKGQHFTAVHKARVSRVYVLWRFEWCSYVMLFKSSKDCTIN